MFSRIYSTYDLFPPSDLKSSSRAMILWSNRARSASANILVSDATASPYATLQSLEMASDDLDYPHGIRLHW